MNEWINFTYTSGGTTTRPNLPEKLNWPAAINASESVILVKAIPLERARARTSRTSGMAFFETSSVTADRQSASYHISASSLVMVAPLTVIANELVWSTLRPFQPVVQVAFRKELAA